MGTKIRFGDLVRKSGRPEIVTLWTKPNENPSFRNALKSNRVLTVIQGDKKRDFGQIGYHPGTQSLYLVFPRPLMKNHREKVIGINYDLLEQPPASGPIAAMEPKKSS